MNPHGEWLSGGAPVRLPNMKEALLMKKTLGLLLAAVLLLSLMPAAFAADDSLSGTVKFWYTADESNPNDFAAVWHRTNIELFQAAHPGVKIEATVVADGNDYLTKITTEMAAGNAPDVFRTWLTGRLEPFVTAGRVMPLNDLVAATPALQEVISSDAISLSTFGDSFYAFPLLSSGEMVFYNKKIFADNGIEVPASYDEFIAACTTLKNNGVLPVAMGGKDVWPCSIPYMMIFDRLNGPELYEEVVVGKTAKFDDPAFIAAGEKFQEMVNAGVFSPECNAISYSDATTSFAQGKAAMIFDGSWQTSYYGTQLGEDVGFFNFPMIEGGKGSANNWLKNYDDAYAISSNTQNKEAAGAFLAFMFSKERQKEFGEYGNILAVKGVELDTTKIMPLMLDISEAFAGSDYFEIPWDNPLGTNIGTEVNVVCQGIIAGQNVTDLFTKLQKLAQLEWA